MIINVCYCMDRRQGQFVGRQATVDKIYVHNLAEYIERLVLCVFQCQPTALLRASGSAQGGYMAFGVVYFRTTHRLGRPLYVWDEYLL